MKSIAKKVANQVLVSSIQSVWYEFYILSKVLSKLTKYQHFELSLKSLVLDFSTHGQPLLLKLLTVYGFDRLSMPKTILSSLSIH